MPEPTVTRKILRHRLCRMLNMEFYDRYSAGELTSDTTSTTSLITAGELTQADDYWNGVYALITSGAALDDIRLITDFTDSSDSLVPDYPLTAAPDGATFELIENFTPQMIHDAINRAIEEAGKHFPVVVTDETLVVKEDTLKYDISGLTYGVWKLFHVYLEWNTISKLDIATAGGATTIDADMFDTDDEYNGWLISIYDGTGAGQLRTISDVVGSTTQATVSVAWATQPDTTSEFRVWNPSNQEIDWRLFNNWRLDQWDDATYIFFNELPETYNGFRIRLNYASRPTALTLDADTTEIPAEYIINYALHVLHQSKVEDNRSDYKRHQELADKYYDLAKQFMVANEPQMPTQTILISEDPGVQGFTGMSSEVGNPLGW